MHHLTRSDGPFSSFLAARGWPARFHAQVPAVLWLQKPGSGPREHMAIPSDLYVLTVYCDEHLLCGEHSEAAPLEVMVSALRTRPAPFRSAGGGELAVAMMTPLGLLNALGAPLEGLTDRRLPLADFCGWREQRVLRDAMLGARSPDERLYRLCSWLERRITSSRMLTGAVQRAAAAAIEIERHADVELSMDALARRLAVGRRQLERDFKRWIGVSPGGYSRLVRFQRAVADVAAGVALPQVAAVHGYVDQPHMTHAFRDLAGITPGELAQRARTQGNEALRQAMAGRLVMSHAEPHACLCPSA